MSGLVANGLANTRKNTSHVSLSILDRRFGVFMA